MQINHTGTVLFQTITILSTPVLQNIQGHERIQLQQFWRTVIVWQRNWPDIRITYCPSVRDLSTNSIVQGPVGISAGKL